MINRPSKRSTHSQVQGCARLEMKTQLCQYKILNMWDQCSLWTSAAPMRQAKAKTYRLNKVRACLQEAMWAQLQQTIMRIFRRSNQLPQAKTQALSQQTSLKPQECQCSQYWVRSLSLRNISRFSVVEPARLLMPLTFWQSDEAHIWSSNK